MAWSIRKPFGGKKSAFRKYAVSPVVGLHQDAVQGAQGLLGPKAPGSPPELASGTPTFADILKQIQGMQDVPTVGSGMPGIEAILGQGSQFLTTQLEAIDRSTGANVASAQSDAQARGLTGSDIEAAMMGGARTAGEEQKAGVRGQFGLNQANQLSQMSFAAMQGDRDAEINILTMLAQAMGQEKTAQQDLQLAYAQLKSMDSAARRAFWGEVFGGIMKGAGAYAGAK